MGLFGISDGQRREMQRANAVIAEAERHGFAGKVWVSGCLTQGGKDQEHYDYAMRRADQARTFLETRAEQNARAMEGRVRELEARVAGVASNTRPHPFSDDRSW